jgi:hypothetical protein
VRAQARIAWSTWSAERTRRLRCGRRCRRSRGRGGSRPTARRERFRAVTSLPATEADRLVVHPHDVRQVAAMVRAKPWSAARRPRWRAQPDEHRLHGVGGMVDVAQGPAARMTPTALQLSRLMPCQLPRSIFRYRAPDQADFRIGEAALCYVGRKLRRRPQCALSGWLSPAQRYRETMPRIAFVETLVTITLGLL